MPSQNKLVQRDSQLLTKEQLEYPEEEEISPSPSIFEDDEIDEEEAEEDKHYEFWLWQMLNKRD